MPGLVAIVGQGDFASQHALLTSMLGTMRHEESYLSEAASFAEEGVSVGWTAHDGSFAKRVSCYEHPDGSVVIFCGECVGRLPGMAQPPLESPEVFARTLIEGTRANGPAYL